MDPLFVAIFDCGLGNVRSVANALSFLNIPFQLATEKTTMLQAKAWILPGVGAFPAAMETLKNMDMVEFLKDTLGRNQIPTLGICLGMQLLAEFSDEGGLHEGLQIIPGHVKPIATKSGLPVPHVGWNSLNKNPTDPLFSRSSNNPAMYFDHSFQFECPKEYVIATSDYGVPLVAAVRKGNIFGVQFHPEKSQLEGLRVLKAFAIYANILSPEGHYAG